MKILNRFKRSTISRVSASRLIRANRVRYKIKKISLFRLSVFRSNKNIHAQIINNATGCSVAYATSASKEFKTLFAGKTGLEKAAAIGKEIADKAKKVGVDHVAFDKGAYKFWGRVKALAEAADKNGLICTSKLES